MGQHIQVGYFTCSKIAHFQREPGHLQNDRIKTLYNSIYQYITTVYMRVTCYNMVCVKLIVFSISRTFYK
jgi:hypothetical protein